MNGRFIVHVVDDEEGVRESLAALLELNGFAVRQFSSGGAFLENASYGEPGCALVDLRMPGLDGMRLLEQLGKRNIALPVIMMTGFGEVATAVKAMKAGAVDFLEKPLQPDELIAALRRISAQSVTSAQRSVHADENREQSIDRLSRLTAREREVFDLLVAGRTNKEVGRTLGISPRTVEIHRSRVMQKFEAARLSDLIRSAIAAGGG